jgi:hypothetical protein
VPLVIRASEMIRDRLITTSTDGPDVAASPLASLPGGAR